MSSVAQVEFQSAALGRQVSYSVILPEVGEPPFNVLYQLHGYSDDQHAWIQRSNLIRHASALPFLIVLPAGDNSYWLGAFERFLVEDLPANLARNFRVREGRAAIGGLSMGGFGALRLALAHPERYASAYAHSPRLHDDELLELIARADAATLPALALDCGRDDHLIADSRRIHAALEARALPHGYAEHEGGHDWDYWDAHVPAALAHHARALAIAR
jgi:putative tributyrin esterase